MKPQKQRIVKKTEQKMTVRDLTKELNKVSKECVDYDVLIWAPSDMVLCVTKTDIDENNEVRICLEQEGDDGGYYTVDMLKDELEGYDENAPVYLAGSGLYMTFDQSEGIFIEDTDSEIVGAYTSIFGKYKEEEEEDEVGWITIEERKEMAKELRKQRLQKRWAMALVTVITILIILAALS